MHFTLDSKIEHRCMQMQGKERPGTRRVEEAPANLVCSSNKALLTKTDMTCNARPVILVMWPNKKVHAKVGSSCCSSSRIPALLLKYNLLHEQTALKQQRLQEALQVAGLAVGRISPRSVRCCRLRPAASGLVHTDAC